MIVKVESMIDSFWHNNRPFCHPCLQDQYLHHSEVFVGPKLKAFENFSQKKFFFFIIYQNKEISKYG
jgi:hypothetical protein